MFKRVGTIFIVMLALPALAHAWTISARVASGSGNIYKGTTPILPTPGYVSVDNTTPSQDLTVTPTAGSIISSVIVDGKPAVPVSPNVYRVNYNSTNSHSIIAYFVAPKYTVTNTQVVGIDNGNFTVQQTAPVTTTPTTGNLTNVPAGAKIKVVATPKQGYRVVKITIGGADFSPASPLAAGTSFSAPEVSVSSNISVSASYALTPVVSINSLTTSPVPILNNTSVSLTIAASGNATAGTLSYTVAIKDSAGNPARMYGDGNRASGSSILIAPPYYLTLTGNVATFGYYQSMHYSYYLAPGDYSAVVTATGANGGSDSMFVRFSVLDAEVYATNSCAGCHRNSSPAIVTNWEAGKHAAPRTQENDNICFRCHTAEGYLYAEKNAYTGNVDSLLAFPTVTSLPLTASPIGCATCHTPAPHNGALRPVIGWTAAETGAAAEQFNVCTGCHTLSVKDSLGNQQLSQHYHTAGWVKLGRIISDTHFDNPATANGIEGYVVRVNSASPCADCHDMHKADIQPPGLIPNTSAPPTIHQQWARSGHAGQILKIKEDYVKANFSAPSGVPGSNTTGELDSAPERTAANVALVTAQAATDASAPAWVHYDWESASYQSCQHCHTTTGAANYLSNRAGYDPANNDFSHLNGWNTTTRTSSQNEVLYCWGCHSNAGTGKLHNTGSLLLDYKNSNTATANIVIPAIGNGNSTACFSCHMGRGNVVSLMGSATAPFTVANPAKTLTDTTVPKNSATATATHYFNAGATIFKNETRVGYEFPEKNYANPSYFAHNSIGCTDCHMSSTQTHSFAAVKKNTAGAITALVASNCVTCHSGEHGPGLVTANTTTPFGLQTAAAAAAFLEEEAKGYGQALAAFNQALIAKGYTWTPSYPYFTFTSADPAVAALKWRTEGDLGAGHNYNYLLHEPGAYAHNSLYAKRLIFDSLDWLDNEMLDGSISVNASASPEAATWFGAPAGTTGSYTAARP